MVTRSGCNTVQFGQDGVNFIGVAPRVGLITMVMGKTMVGKVMPLIFSVCGTMVLGVHEIVEVMHNEAASAGVVGCYRNRGCVSDCGWHIHPLGSPYASRTSSAFPERATCWTRGTTRTAPRDGTASEAKVRRPCTRDRQDLASERVENKRSSPEVCWRNEFRCCWQASR